MKKLILLAAILLFYTYSFSQGKWHNGFIINQENDTLYGLLANINTSTSSKECKFRKTDTSEIKTYYPRDILEYNYLEKKVFVSREVKVESKTKKVFLEFLVKGRVNLYHYKENSESYYFAEKDGTIIELKNTIVTKRKGNKAATIEYKEYINTLNYILADANMQSEILDADFSTETLIKLSKDYHNRVCDDGACIVYEKKLVKPEYSFSAYLGANMTQFNYNEYLSTDFSPSYSVGGRIEIENFIEWVENFSVSIDLQYLYYTKTVVHGRNITPNKYPIYYNNQEYVLSDYYTPTVYIENNDAHAAGVETKTQETSLKVDLKTSSISIPLSINYNYLLGEGTLYFGIGINNLIVISQADFRISVNEWEPKYFSGAISHNNCWSIKSNPPMKAAKSYYLGWLGKVGYKYPLLEENYLFVEFEFDRFYEPNFSEFKPYYAEEKNKITQFSLKIGYEL